MGNALPLSSNDRRGAAFKAAWRHARFVRFLRWAIPFASVLTVVGTIAFIYFEPLKSLPVNIDVDKLNLDGSKITMDHAKLRGFKDGDLPFTILADQAIQDVSTPYIVDLRALNADITMPDRTVAKITAESGIYDSQKDALNARGNVNIQSPRYTVKMKSGLIDFKTNKIVSKEPVTVTMSAGTIDADGMNVFDNGSRVQFVGRVRSVFRRAPVPESGGNTP